MEIFYRNGAEVNGNEHYISFILIKYKHEWLWKVIFMYEWEQIIFTV